MKPAEVINTIAPLISFEESGFSCDGGDYYSAESLYARAAKEKAKSYKLMLRDIDFSVHVWRADGVRLADYAYHARRALNTDLEYPIIVGPLGGIMDGFHRVLGALLDGREYVMAKRLKELPEPGVDPDKDKSNG